jgi:hypothetical protein
MIGGKVLLYSINCLDESLPVTGRTFLEMRKRIITDAEGELAKVLQG